MRIQVKGRNISISDELREHVEKRFLKISKQVSELARLDVEVWHEPNPRIADSEVVEVTLHVKGRPPLRARDASPNMDHSVNLVYEELARQVKRHKAKQRHRREQRAAHAHGVSSALWDDPEIAGGDLRSQVPTHAHLSVTQALHWPHGIA